MRERERMNWDIRQSALRGFITKFSTFPEKKFPDLTSISGKKISGLYFRKKNFRIQHLFPEKKFPDSISGKKFSGNGIVSGKFFSGNRGWIRKIFFRKGYISKYIRQLVIFFNLIFFLDRNKKFGIKQYQKLKITLY